MKSSCIIAYYNKPWHPQITSLGDQREDIGAMFSKIRINILSQKEWVEMTNSFTTGIDSTAHTFDKSPQISTVKVRGPIEDSRSSAQEEETRNMEKPRLWHNLVTMMFTSG
jgi:hypothetical protein